MQVTCWTRSGYGIVEGTLIFIGPCIAKLYGTVDTVPNGINHHLNYRRKGFHTATTFRNIYDTPVVFFF